MKRLMKYGYILHSISILGIILLFLFVKSEWLMIDTVYEKVIATLFAITLTGAAGQYWWEQYRKDSSKF